MFSAFALCDRQDLALLSPCQSLAKILLFVHKSTPTPMDATILNPRIKDRVSKSVIRFMACVACVGLVALSIAVVYLPLALLAWIVG
jgi:hypothetical protein